NGTKIWQVNCTDAAGYIGNSSVYTYYEDTTTPTIYLNSPTSGAVNNTANITASFSFIDAYSQNASCVLKLDGATLTTNATTQNNTNTTIFGAVGNGTHIWQVNCTDLGSNLGASSVYNYIEDTVAPTIYLVNPADTAWNNTGNISVQFSFTDPGSQNATCFLYLNGVSSATNSTTQNNTNTTLTAVATNGIKTWQVNCTDLASYVGASSTQTYYEDTTTPTVYLNSPVDGAINNTANITASFSFIDAYSQNASCVLSLNGAALTTNATTQNNTNTTIFGVATNGTKVWQVNCTDSGSNLGASSTRTYLEDTVAPSVYLTTPTNSYYNNSAAPTFTFSFIDPASINASCTLYVNGSAYGTNTAVSNNTNTSITTNTSLTAGIRAWEVNCTDLASYVGNSSNYILITDLLNPAAGIAWVNDLTVSADGTTNNTLRVNFTMSDTNFKNWTLKVYNSTPVLVATWNDTVNNNSQVLSYAAVSNGTYYINLTVWDNSSRTNTSTVFAIYVDQINPVLIPTNVSGYSTTGVTLTTSASDSISAIDYCNYSGAGSGNFTLVSGVYTVNITGLVSSTQYTATIRCYDLAGNLNSTTVTFTTWAVSSSSSSSSSGGGGAGGSTAGVPTSVAGQFEQKTWTSIYKGETATVESVKDGLGITKVEFKVTQNVYGAWVKVSRVDKADLSASTKAFSNKAYQYLEIKKNEVAFKEGSISAAKINIKVEKSWLDSNKLDKYSIALFRYAGDKWNELTTSYEKEDEKYVYYSAPTPGFSYFVVGQKAAVTAPAKAETPATTAPTAGITPVTKEKKEEAVAPSTEGVSGTVSESLVWPWIVAAIGVIVIVVLLWKMFQKKK
ncbi:PGF-pre-PGF domain-containing protein, partial [Candidatus Woesearchaeota archaeon]|nr:PGF-pre-PGF domain-containing protein [Candidatus Woesearchaeota archaeon]